MPALYCVNEFILADQALAWEGSRCDSSGSQDTDFYVERLPLYTQLNPRRDGLRVLRLFPPVVSCHYRN